MRITIDSDGAQTSAPRITTTGGDNYPEPPRTAMRAARADASDGGPAPSGPGATQADGSSSGSTADSPGATMHGAISAGAAPSIS